MPCFEELDFDIVLGTGFTDAAAGDLGGDATACFAVVTGEFREVFGVSEADSTSCGLCFGAAALISGTGMAAAEGDPILTRIGPVQSPTSLMLKRSKNHTPPITAKWTSRANRTPRRILLLSN